MCEIYWLKMKWKNRVKQIQKEKPSLIRCQKLGSIILKKLMMRKVKFEKLNCIIQFGSLIKTIKNWIVNRNFLFEVILSKIHASCTL